MIVLMVILMISASSVPNSPVTIFRRFMPGVIATYYTIVIAEPVAGTSTRSSGTKRTEESSSTALLSTSARPRGSSWRGAVLPWTRRYISNISYILLFLVAQEAKLTIDPILTTDEGEYKCEITFLDISKNCPVVQLVKLTTLAR